MSGVLEAVDWQPTVPFWLIDEMALSLLHAPLTRLCTAAGSTLRPTSPEVPPPVSPAPAPTPVMVPAPVDWHLTEPSAVTCAIADPLAQLWLTRA
jgi:hypothetical protein